MNEGGGSNRQFRNPRAPKQPKGYSEEAVLSDDEVLRRVDLRGAPGEAQPDWIGDSPDAAGTAWIGGAPGAASELPEPDRSPRPAPVVEPELTLFEADPALALLPQRVEAVRRDRLAQDDRRRQLWRDSSLILICVVLALIVGQTLAPSQTAGPDGSPTPLPSTIAIGSVGPPVSIAPGATFGPIINPSLGIDATPTPIPVITMGPTQTPSPSPTPTPTVRPSASIKPTPKPTPKPTKTPSPTPTPEPTPPPTPPPPSARFTWSVDFMTVTFDNNSTGVITGETTWVWDFDDGSTSSARNPAPHLYVDICTEEAPCFYDVMLTMTTPVGTDSVTHTVQVPPTP